MKTYIIVNILITHFVSLTLYGMNIDTMLNTPENARIIFESNKLTFTRRNRFEEYIQKELIILPYVSVQCGPIQPQCIIPLSANDKGTVFITGYLYTVPEGRSFGMVLRHAVGEHNTITTKSYFTDDSPLEQRKRLPNQYKSAIPRSVVTGSGAVNYYITQKQKIELEQKMSAYIQQYPFLCPSIPDNNIFPHWSSHYVFNETFGYCDHLVVYEYSRLGRVGLIYRHFTNRSTHQQINTICFLKNGYDEKDMLAAIQNLAFRLDAGVPFMQILFSRNEKGVERVDKVVDVRRLYQ